MSYPATANVRRALCQSPAAFLRQCRADACASSRRRPAATASPHRTYSSAGRGRSLVFAKKLSSAPSPSSPSSSVQSKCDSHMRSFSASASPWATAVLQNPRVDEDGVEMTIEISDRATRRLEQITSSPSKTVSGQDSPPYNHLRVSVTSGGCHGFQYLMSLEAATAIEEDEDTIFAARDSPGAAKVVMDEASLELLKGSTIDYTTELIGSQFKIVGNPRAKSSCGCGTSFDIED